MTRRSPGWAARPRGRDTTTRSGPAACSSSSTTPRTARTTCTPWSATWSVTGARTCCAATTPTSTARAANRVAPAGPVGNTGSVGHVDVAGVRYELPDGRVLLDDVSFRVGEGAKVALVGANGAGKTTLLRIITGELQPHAGVVTRSGGLGVMRQHVARGSTTVADLLLSVSPERVRAAAAEVDRLELRLMEVDDEATQMSYATALAEFADAGGYDIEVV